MWLNPFLKIRLKCEGYHFILFLSKSFNVFLKHLSKAFFFFLDFFLPSVHKENWPNNKVQAFAQTFEATAETQSNALLDWEWFIWHWQRSSKHCHWSWSSCCLCSVYNCPVVMFPCYIVGRLASRNVSLKESMEKWSPFN